jgi:hypothetical protein
MVWLALRETVMAYLLVFLAFATKHFFASNTLDVGYTNARDRHEHYWWAYLLAQIVLDAAMSLPAYYILGYRPMILMFVLESCVLALTALWERTPDYHWMMTVHVIAELLTLVFYGYLTFMVFHR